MGGGPEAARWSRARRSGATPEAAETRHRVFRVAGGADDDWPSWYAQWLIDLPEPPDLPGARPVRSKLIYLLASLDEQFHSRGSGEPREIYYAPDPAAFPAIRQLTPGPGHTVLWAGRIPGHAAMMVAGGYTLPKSGSSRMAFSRWAWVVSYCQGWSSAFPAASASRRVRKSRQRTTCHR
jgi:hypothetical protein